MYYLTLWYSYIILVPALILSVYASVKVNMTYSKYGKVESKSNWTASDATRMMLEKNGCMGVSVGRVSGKLTDHYDPRSHTLNLSDGVYNSSSIAALGVAAHETGHAVQHREEYFPLKLRSVLVPVTNIGSRLALPLLVIGVIVELIAYGTGIEMLGTILILVGIIAYSLTAVFALVTLPVEINASRRAAVMLSETGVLDDGEVKKAKKVLNAAALTYVAALAVSIMSIIRLLYLLSLVRRKD